MGEGGGRGGKKVRTVKTTKISLLARGGGPQEKEEAWEKTGSVTDKKRERVSGERILIVREAPIQKRKVLRREAKKVGGGEDPRASKKEGGNPGGGAFYENGMEENRQKSNTGKGTYPAWKGSFL